MKKRYVSRVSGKVGGTGVTLWGVFDKQEDKFIIQGSFSRAYVLAEASRLNEQGTVSEVVNTKCDCCGRSVKSDELEMIDVPEREFDGGACATCKPLLTGREDHANMAVTFVAKRVDREDLAKGIREALADAQRKKLFNEEGTKWEVYINTIVGGTAGSYQGERIMEFFELPVGDHNRDHIHEEIDSFESHVADVLTNAMRKYHGLTGQLWFGNLETDGSYGLFYSQEIPTYEAVIFDAWKAGESVWTDMEDMLREKPESEWEKGFVIGGDVPVIEAIEESGTDWFKTYGGALQVLADLNIGHLNINTEQLNRERGQSIKQNHIDSMNRHAQRNPWYGHLVGFFAPKGWYVEDFAGNNYGLFKEFPTKNGGYATVMVVEMGASIVTDKGTALRLDDFIFLYQNESTSENVLDHCVSLIDRKDNPYHDIDILDALPETFDAPAVKEITEAVKEFVIEYWKGGGYSG